MKTIRKNKSEVIDFKDQLVHIEDAARSVALLNSYECSSILRVCCDRLSVDVIESEHKQLVQGLAKLKKEVRELRL